MNEDCYHLGIKALIRHEGKILLLKVNPKQLRNATKAYWDIPGGRVQRGGSVEETLRREIEEETGITELVSTTPFLMVLSKIRIPTDTTDYGLILWVHFCDIVELPKIVLSEEHTEYGWFTPAEASDLLTVKYPKEFTDGLRRL